MILINVIVSFEFLNILMSFLVFNKLYGFYLIVRPTGLSNEELADQI